MMYIINIRGLQVHSDSCLTHVSGDFLIFENGNFCNIKSADTFGKTGMRFVQQDDEAYVTPGTPSTDERIVITVTEKGGTTLFETDKADVIRSSGGKIFAIIDPGSTDRGVQIGDNNVAHYTFRNQRR